MGLLNCAIEYKENIRTLYECLDELDRTIVLMGSAQTRKELDRQSYSIRQCVNWLEESREDLFEKIDELLEDR